MKALLTVKIDPQVKIQAASLASQFGLALSDIVNVSLRQFINSRSLHLEQPWRMSAELEKVIAKAEADLAAGKASPKFSDAETAAAFLGI